MKTNFSKKEHSDSGLALILILLIVSLIWHMTGTLKIAVVVTLLLMVKPAIMYPFTFIWLNLSDVLGKIISKVILAIIYVVFLVPMGLIRKAMGRDSLKLNQFRKSTNSVFETRNHTYNKEDMLNTF
jgi:hypothetical protein